MGLGDVMGASGLHVYAEVGLLISAVTFLYVLATTLARRNGPTFERIRWMPLEEDDTATRVGDRETGAEAQHARERTRP